MPDAGMAAKRAIQRFDRGSRLPDRLACVGSTPAGSAMFADMLSSFGTMVISNWVAPSFDVNVATTSGWRRRGRPRVRGRRRAVRAAGSAD